MSAPPIWRRAGGAGGRMLAGLVALSLLTLTAILLALPLYEAWADAQDRAQRLDQRAAALTAAAAARRAEAAIAAPPAEAVEAAEAYLDSVAPRRDAGAALLDLVSTTRLLAQAAEVELQAATPVDLSRASDSVFTLGPEAGLSAVAVEARLVTDHAGLVRFLTAIEQAKPVLRAAALDLSAKTPRADQEAGRLTARVVIGGLIRAEGG